VTALLFERDAVDEIDDWIEGIPRLRRSSVLWIDLERPDEKELERLVDVLDLTDLNVGALTGGPGRPAWPANGRRPGPPRRASR
jgi:hypothetical protein